MFLNIWNQVNPNLRSTEPNEIARFIKISYFISPGTLKYLRHYTEETKLKHFNFNQGNRWRGTIPDIPAFRQSEIISTDLDFEPSVPTIFVIAGKAVCR